MIGALLGWHKPKPRLTDAEKAASAASYLSRYAARKRTLTAKQLRDTRTNELRQCIATGQIAKLGWRA